jgi:hypothetical protein
MVAELSGVERARDAGMSAPPLAHHFSFFRRRSHPRPSRHAFVLDIVRETCYAPRVKVTLSMASKVIIPLNDFADVVARVKALEARLADVEAWRKTDGVYTYGPCLRCGYGPWDSYQARPSRNCPRCHSAYWNMEPRNGRGRKPTDPPAKSWAGAKPSPRMRFATAPKPRKDAALPPELRPDEAIPPPPTLADVGVLYVSTYGVPATAPSLSEALRVKMAAMPDVVVERIVAGEMVSYDEIKAAKADDAERGTDNGQPAVPISDVPSRPEPPALAAKKAEFFAGFAVPEAAADASAPPFVAPSLAPPLDADDDEFWK